MSPDQLSPDLLYGRGCITEKSSEICVKNIETFFCQKSKSLHLKIWHHISKLFATLILRKQIETSCQKSKLFVKNRNFLSKIETFCQKSKLFVKNRNFLSKIETFLLQIVIFVKIDLFVKNRKLNLCQKSKLCQKLKSLSKIKIFVKNFCCENTVPKISFRFDNSSNNFFPVHSSTEINAD